MAELMARVARLDHDQVFWGLQDPVPLEQIKSGDFVFGPPAIQERLPQGATYVDREADNAPGRYKLLGPDATRPFAHFVALEPRLVKSVPDAPSADRALYELCLDQYRVRHVLPKYTLDWALWYELTNDAPHVNGVPVAALAGVVKLVNGGA